MRRGELSYLFDKLPNEDSRLVDRLSARFASAFLASIHRPLVQFEETRVPEPKQIPPSPRLTARRSPPPSAPSGETRLPPGCSLDALSFAIAPLRFLSRPLIRALSPRGRLSQTLRYAHGSQKLTREPGAGSVPSPR
jgi:hypothetical protein